jgi:predicted membrane protein
MRSKTLMLFAARAFVAALVTVVPLSAQSQTLTPFDPTGSTFTNPVSINATETITGFYSDAAFLNHGFLRAPEGTITTFDAPGAAQGTFPQQINPAGTIAGYYTDASSVNHGFVRAADGTIRTFDAPGAGTGSFQGTTASSIKPGGRSQETTPTRPLLLTASSVP